MLQIVEISTVSLGDYSLLVRQGEGGAPTRVLVSPDTLASYGRTALQIRRATDGESFGVAAVEAADDRAAAWSEVLAGHGVELAECSA